MEGSERVVTKRRDFDNSDEHMTEQFLVYSGLPRIQIEHTSVKYFSIRSKLPIETSIEEINPVVTNEQLFKNEVNQH